MGNRTSTTFATTLLCIVLTQLSTAFAPPSIPKPSSRRVLYVDPVLSNSESRFPTRRKQTTGGDEAELFQRSLLAERLRMEMIKRLGSPLEVVDVAPVVEEYKPPQPLISTFAFQRSLLEARLAMEANASRRIKDTLDDTGKEDVLKILTEPVIETPSVSIREDSDEESSVSNENESVGKEHPAASVTVDAIGAPKSAEIISNYAFHRSLLKARLEMENRKQRESRSYAEVKKTNIAEIIATTAEATEECTKSSVVREVEISTVGINEASLVEPLEETKPLTVLPPPEPRKKVKRPSYWETLSAEDVSSNLVKSFTPEKGLRELNKEPEADLLGFAASRLAWGFVEGGKAAFFGVKAVAGQNTEEEALLAAGEATQKLVSALTAFTSLGLKQGKRAQEYYEKAKAERIEADKIALAARIEAEKIAEEARKLEEERKRLEAERLAAEQQLEDERVASEKLALEAIRARAEEAKNKVDEERSMAEMEAIEEVRRTTEMKKRLMTKIENGGTKTPTPMDKIDIFFADEI